MSDVGCRKLDVGTRMTREKGWARILASCDKLKWEIDIWGICFCFRLCERIREAEWGESAGIIRDLF